MSSLRDQFRAARDRAGLSQPALSRATSWDVGHISKFERGSHGASLEKLEEWLAVCHSHVVVVPNEPTTDLDELHGLSDDQRKLLVRLGRVLPHLPAEVVDLSIVALLERWERAYLSDEPSDSSASTDQERAASSA